MPNYDRQPWRVEAQRVFWRGYTVKGADPQSFEALNAIWGRDDTGIYCQGSRWRKADRNSFVVLNMLWARDANHAYYSYGTVAAVPDSFRALDSGENDTRYGFTSYAGFATDERQVFHYGLTVGKPSVVRHADPKSFRVLGHEFAVDAIAAYHRRCRLSKANPGTLRLLGRLYATDGVRVFYANREMVGADATTFEVSPNDDTLANDAHRHYRIGRAQA